MIDYTIIRRDMEVLLASFLSVPVQFENTRIDETDTFVAVTTQESRAISTGMGEDSFQVSGDAIFQIFTPLFSGTEKSRAIASEISNALSNSQADSMSFQVPVLQTAGQVPETDLFQQNLIVPFEYFYAGTANNC